MERRVSKAGKMDTAKQMNSGSDIPLIVHVVFSLGTGGLENGLVNIINRMPQDRYRHAIVCLTEAGEFASRIMQPGVPVISLHSGQGHSFGLYWQLWKTFRTLNPTIVHSRNLATLEAQIPARLLSGVKTVHGEHGRDVFDLEGKNKKYNLLRKMVRPFVGRYVTVSKDLKRWLMETVGVSKRRVVQIYNGVDQEQFHPGDGKPMDLPPAGFLSAESFVIGTVGRLAAVKDQATLIRAFKLLLDANPADKNDLRLVIAGDGPLRRELEELVSELGIARSVWITGDRSDIADVLRLFDLFVLSSLGEGISNTILEAMATGLPIVATDVGGNPELVQEGVTGRLIPGEDPAVLAASLQQCIGDREQLIRMGAASLEKVKTQFNWQKTVEQYLSVYDEVVNS
jgi:sugar transferase (PEP-CTERM/EpsH1 system associated)